jgi:tRNA pseudouridine55 synthase
VHGWIILDKPLGLGSTQAVSAVKRALRAGGYGKLKVGHGGTLDPLATGVLPVAIGEATKLAGRLLDSDKVYEFTIRFGEETDTLDAEGAAVTRSDVRPTRREAEAILPLFTGPIEQVPPAYSALKVDGERAYDLARTGAEVKLASRAVTVHSLKVEGRASTGSAKSEIDDMGADTSAGSAELVEALPSSTLAEITLTAHVSKGTYIRSLARDIAYALGSVGHVTMLRRLKAGPFTLESAISLDNLTQFAKARALTRMGLPLAAGLDDIPALPVTPDQARLLRHGQMLFGIPATPGLYLATEAETPVALVEFSEDGCKVVRGFNLET